MSTTNYTRQAKCSDCNFIARFYSGKRKYHFCIKKNKNRRLRDSICKEYNIRYEHFPRPMFFDAMGIHKSVMTQIAKNYKYAILINYVDQKAAVNCKLSLITAKTGNPNKRTIYTHAIPCTLNEYLSFKERGVFRSVYLFRTEKYISIQTEKNIP